MNEINLLIKLFEKWAEETAVSIKTFPYSGSNRQYFRINGKIKKAIGVYNPDKNENEAFNYLTNHFHSKKLPVPEIYSIDLKNNIYLQQDLGDVTLFGLVIEEQKINTFSDKLVEYYKEVILQLIKFQINGHIGLDYSKCYPNIEYNKEYMQWDLNYFKYYFLKLIGIEFDEMRLSDDFNEIIKFLIQAPGNYFMYRDFQTRNVIIFEDKPYFVDYQGGRKGALQYDIASLLFQAKAKIPENIKDELFNFYINELSKAIGVNIDEFKKYYFGFVLIRILQTLGAYGYRGYYQRKGHFIQSMPIALNNLYSLCSDDRLKIKIPYLKGLIIKAIAHSDFKEKVIDNERLTIKVSSFSYKKTGIPFDYSGHGGGFVFDCRALPNPYKEEKLRDFTGKDKEINDFFMDKPEMDEFLKNVYNLVNQSIENYQNRGFNNLSVCFGCTGGMHRSVYCAEKLVENLKQRKNIIIEIDHTEEESWKKIL